MKSVLYRRVEGVSTQELDGELFLASRSNGSIYHLNAMATAFWRALQEPCRLTEVVDLFCAAFPERARAELQRDIKALAEEMQAQGLIRRATD